MGLYMVGQVVFVKRSVLKAAQRLEALSGNGKDADPVDLAEFKIADCQAADDESGVRFWRAVWTHMMRVRQGVHCLNVVDDDDNLDLIKKRVPAGAAASEAALQNETS
jgi:hypothetical protein